MTLAIRLSTSWLTHIKQWICGLRGHCLLLDVEADRVAAWCAWCGYASPGWELETRSIRYAWMWERHRMRWKQRRRA